MVQEDVKLSVKSGLSVHQHRQGSRVLQRPGQWETVPFVEACKVADSNISATVTMVSATLPSHPRKAALPDPGKLEVKPVTGDETLYKVSHNGDSIQFRVEDSFLRLKSYKCPTDGPDGLKTPAQKEFGFRDGPLMFDTRWLPFESLSKVGYTGFRLPPSLASSTDVVTKYIQWLYYGVSLNALQ
ncbi:hypothetical protein FOZ63_009414, partial [Perkinsus olseni]